jgi:hypothetical protein
MHLRLSLTCLFLAFRAAALPAVPLALVDDDERSPFAPKVDLGSTDVASSPPDAPAPSAAKNATSSIHPFSAAEKLEVTDETPSNVAPPPSPPLSGGDSLAVDTDAEASTGILAPPPTVPSEDEEGEKDVDETSTGNVEGTDHDVALRAELFCLSYKAPVCPPAVPPTCPDPAEAFLAKVYEIHKGPHAPVFTRRLAGAMAAAFDHENVRPNCCFPRVPQISDLF